jgi:hypothetical protein
MARITVTTGEIEKIAVAMASGAAADLLLGCTHAQLETQVALHRR